MLTEILVKNIEQELSLLAAAGRMKNEYLISGPQGPEVTINNRKLLMFASNNYLGLANEDSVVKAAQTGLSTYGHGLSSVRFICGTQTIHHQLERKLADFLGVEEAILYSSNFMANLGFFASLVNEPFAQASYQDIIYSDELNHASIIDALKLIKRENVIKRIYPHGDTKALASLLEQDKGLSIRHRFIVTDGVFSMEGDAAPLDQLVKLANRYQALLFVDDAHGVGVLGANGAGTPEVYGLRGQIDVLSGTLGKALGGALGGYLAGRKEIIDFLRQKSRPYIFSNSLPPMIVAASLRVLDLIKDQPELFRRLIEQADYFRHHVRQMGFKTTDGHHPIVPVMLGDAKLCQQMSGRLFAEGLYVVALSFPVVPEGAARLRFQISAAHSREQIDQALHLLAQVGREFKVIR